MAGMDLSLRRANRGISVFWLILAMGAGVFALLAILLISTENATEELPPDSSPEVIVSDGDATFNGVGNTEAAANPNDATFQGDAEVAIPGSGPTAEGDLSTESVEVEVEPAGVVSEDAAVGDAPLAVDAEAGADAIDDGALDEAPGERVTEDENEIVVDPDGTTAPVVPTDSGPEGSDDSALTQD